MRQVENNQPKRRTKGIQREVIDLPRLQCTSAKIVHVVERHVWTRFVAEMDGALFCTENRVERTEEVAFEEGRRELVTQNRKARAAYQIDWLYDGTFYVRVEIGYDTGDHAGVYTHEIFRTRQECIEYFLEISRRHFRGDRCMPELQAEARKQMQELLQPSLFGFIEPSPVP
ncbi:MAG: hypothetical protein KDD69_18340 [Bdellovibrionales bacterium]|nr:hypothetical protein [Bdellovibrionales bacterium]